MTDGCLAGGLRRIGFVPESDRPPIPKRTRSLPNRDLNLSHENHVAGAPGDFGRGGSFRRTSVSASMRLVRASSNGRALARDVELRAQRHKNVVTKTSSSRSIIAVKRCADPSLLQLHMSA